MVNQIYYSCWRLLYNVQDFPSKKWNALTEHSKPIWCLINPTKCNLCHFLYIKESRVMETKRLASLLLSHGLFLLAWDTVSNSISQVFIYYFPFQSRGIFFNFPIHLHTEREIEREREIKESNTSSATSICGSAFVLLQLNYKILLPFSVKITHCGRPYLIWTGGFVTENDTMQLGFQY